MKMKGTESGGELLHGREIVRTVIKCKGKNT